jgi:hypothetical protein
LRRGLGMLVVNSLFWTGYVVALLGAFEQANDNGVPFWSSVLGFPFLHHMYYGFAFVALAWALFMVIVFRGGMEGKNE